MDEEQLLAIIDDAFGLIAEGRPEEGLALLAQVDAKEPERHLLELFAWTELSNWARAEAALVEARRTVEPGEPLLPMYEGRLRLAQWDVDAARACLEQVPEDVGGAPHLESLALLEDLEGNFEAADAWLQRAQVLDPESCPSPFRLPSDDFRALVHEAAEDLPPEFRAAFATVAVVIDPMPTAALLQAPGSGHPPDVLGLFIGLPLHENEARGHGELPPTIFLFQRNLERVCLDREGLREEVRITLYHELGHALGFDEDGVDEMGLG